MELCFRRYNLSDNNSIWTIHSNWHFYIEVTANNFGEIYYYFRLMLKIIIRIAKYILLIFVGLLILLLSSRIQHVEPPQAGEYYYSSFLRNNYTILSACIFLVVGLLIGYYFKLEPLLAGVSLILIFPITAFYESTVYRGSHNLIPFELVVYLLFSLPAIAGIYLGRLISNRITVSKGSKKNLNT